jgi:CHAT domain-containing protein
VTDVDAAAMLSQLYEETDRPVSERLRAVQLDRLESLRAEGKVDHPVSWAAFVAVGN